jgi:hypothetical protein
MKNGNFVVGQGAFLSLQNLLADFEDMRYSRGYRI